MAEILTAEDLEQIREYLEALAMLDRMRETVEPDFLTSAEWDEAWPEIQATGEIPEKYKDRIARDDDGGYFDIARTELQWASNEVEAKYRDIILKALYYAMDTKPSTGEESGGQPLRDLLQAIVDRKQITAEEVRAAIPHLESIVPHKHVMPNNKLANSLTKGIIDAGAIDLVVSGRGKHEITTRCVLSYEGDSVKLFSRQPFTEYDRQVSDAVTSLYVYGDDTHIFTPAAVCRTMVHATETETPSPQQIGAVTRSLDKQRFVRVQIDCSDELTRRKIDLNGAQITGGKIDTYLLALEKVEVMAGGQKVTAYKAVKPPILYEYSQLTGQMLTVPAALLDIRDKNGCKVANTERRIAVKGYLMRRIAVMKGKRGNAQSRHILYDTVYTEIGATDLSRKDQQAIRDYIAIALDSWKREKFISGYTELTQGRKKIGVEIKI